MTDVIYFEHMGGTSWINMQYVKTITTKPAGNVGYLLVIDSLDDTSEFEIGPNTHGAVFDQLSFIYRNRKNDRTI